MAEVAVISTIMCCYLDMLPFRVYDQVNDPICAEYDNQIYYTSLDLCDHSYHMSCWNVSNLELYLQTRKFIDVSLLNLYHYGNNTRTYY